MIILYTLLFTVISALLYRMGGCGQPCRDKWPNLPGWFFDTKARDIGIPLLCGLPYILLAVKISAPWWIHLICFGALFGMLTTYWDFLFKGKDNFYMHGFMCGVAYMFYGIAHPELLLWLGIRAIVMGVFMGVWCKIFSNDLVEEFGRGGIIIATLPLLLIALGGL